MSNHKLYEDTTSSLPDRAELKETAARLQTLGLNPIPLCAITPESKSPFVKKGELKDPQIGYFYRQSNPEDIAEWERRDRYAREQDLEWRWENLAIVTGKTSGVFVLDSDGPEGEALIQKYGDPHIWKSATGKGYQRFYRLPPGLKISNHIRILPELDIKGERGFAVCPPSLHHTGKRYQWINSPFDTDIADAPEWLISAIKVASGEGLTEEEDSRFPQELYALITRTRPNRRSGDSIPSPSKNFIGEEIPEGQRNIELFRKACSWRNVGMEEEQIYEKLLDHNQLYCEPDEYGEILSDEEIRSIAHSASQYKKGSPSYPEVLRAIEGIDAYYRENPLKGMAPQTDKDIIEVFLEEALFHCSIVDDGIEVSISYGSLADKARCSDSTLRKALNERLIADGRFRKGEKPRGTKSGSLVLLSSSFSPPITRFMQPRRIQP